MWDESRKNKYLYVRKSTISIVKLSVSTMLNGGGGRGRNFSFIHDIFVHVSEKKIIITKSLGSYYISL